MADTLTLDRPVMYDKAFINARILSPHDSHVWHGGFAVHRGRFAALWSAESADPPLSSFAEVVDLKGATVIPGLVDAHSHFPDTAIHELFRVVLYGAPRGTIGCIDDIVAALRAHADRTRKDEWVVGYGYEIGSLQEQRHPQAHELDRASSNHPIVILDLTTHFACLNSAALRLCGIDETTTAPRGGEIEHDMHGQPTGVLKEQAVYLVAKKIPEVSYADFAKATQLASADYLRYGFTTVQAGHVWDRRTFDMLRQVVDEGITPLRVVVWPSYALTLELIEAFTDLSSLESERFKIGATKLFCDGEIQGRTAYLRDPYIGCPSCQGGLGRGLLSRETPELARTLKHIRELGRQFAVHAIGDAAIDTVLDAAAMTTDTAGAERRDILVHASLATPDQLHRARHVGLTVSFFSAANFYWGDLFADQYLGSARAERLNPAATALCSGHRISIHTDAPVAPPDAATLAYAAVTRKTAAGRVLGAAEAISPAESLRAMTLDAAWQSFLEDSRGSIELGKLADFAIGAADPLDARVMAERRWHVNETYLGGVRHFPAGG
jgi:hypothetical protein